MDEKDRRRARAILDACEKARRRLHGPGSAKQRGGGARLLFSAYTNDGLLAPHVRDVYHARTLAATEAALTTLEGLARAFAEDQ